MAIITIDQLPSASAVDFTEELAIWQGTTTTKLLLSEAKKFRRTTGVSAAGTDQSGATALSNSFQFYIVSTVGSGAGTKFTALSDATLTDIRIIHVAAGAANDLLHYPASGGTIREQPANIPVIIPKGSTQIFIATSTIDWVTIP
jgi:hypothetical protein